ncbi:MAG TPA: helix-turn-helix domain-containing protein, partial [Solirubrobacterales bacterium]
MKTAKRSRMSTDARREQLLAAGTDLLGRRPYDEVSIGEIAAAAGVSKGLLYHYFPTKKDFVLAALRRGEDELSQLTAPDP